MSGEHLEGFMRGKHVWLSEEFSVPAESLCLKRAPSPDADHFCLRQHEHPGRCQFTWSPTFRAISWKDRA